MERTLVQRLKERGIEARELDYSDPETIPIIENLKGVVEKSFSNFKKTKREAQYETGKNSVWNWLGNKFAPKQKENPESLKHFGKMSDLVFAIHGLTALPGFAENGRGFNRLARQAQEHGYTVIPLSYNDGDGFEKYTTKIHQDIKKLTDSGDFNRVYALGHSTGGDIIRAINAKEGFKDFTGVVMAAPTTNGKNPDFLDRRTFGKKTIYHDLGKPEQNVVETLQTPLYVPGTTITYMSDAFIPFESSFDTKGHNLLVGGGHLMGIGTNGKGNSIYATCLNWLKDKKA